MTAPAPTAEAREIRCPRCGYDQRGALSTWHESCPLEGICTECGLRFRWCEVLLPEKFEPRWCIEYEPRQRRIPWAAVRTWARSHWPWGFWSRLKMSDAIRWRRLIIYLLLLVLVPAVGVYVPIQVALATYVRSTIQTQLAQLAKQRPATIQSLQATVAQMTAMKPTGDAWQDANTKAQIAGLNAELARQQALGRSQETIDSSWLYTTWEALAMPLARVSGANIVSIGGTRAWPYPPPRDLWKMFSMWTAGGSWGGRGTLYFMHLQTAWLAWGVAMTFLLPLSFVLMPLSMRKAKVRWSHIVRVTIYSLFIPMACLSLTALVFAADTVFSLSGLMEMHASFVRYAPWLAVALWWHAATGWYLKIPHAWLTICLLTLMCLLILLGITAALDTQLAWEMMDLFDLLID